MVTRIENKACIWTVCQAGVGCKQAVMIFRVVDVWSALSAFSLPASALGTSALVQLALVPI